MHLFYQADAALSNTIILSEEESRHCAQVMRLQVGDAIHITNGKGILFSCELAQVHHKQCVAAVISTQHESEHLQSKLHIAIAPTKNMDRLEWFVEKATELGIARITPIICNHSERRILKTERLHKIAITAMKQSLKYTLPIIDEAMRLADFMALSLPTQKFICNGEVDGKLTLHHYKLDKDGQVFMVGPEGDFSKPEIEDALNKGFLPLNLGQARLRTETAALHLASVHNFLKLN